MKYKEVVTIEQLENNLNKLCGISAALSKADDKI